MVNSASWQMTFTVNTESLSIKGSFIDIRIMYTEPKGQGIPLGSSKNTINFNDCS